MALHFLSFFMDHFSNSFNYFSEITAIWQQLFILPQERALPTQGGAERGGDNELTKFSQPQGNIIYKKKFALIIIVKKRSLIFLNLLEPRNVLL
jgi:hypothetical protein